MQSADDEIPAWDFSPAIHLLNTLSIPIRRDNISPQSSPTKVLLSQTANEDLSLGNFDRIWEFLSSPRNVQNGTDQRSAEEDAERVAKEVRWRDEVSGADLEDDVDTQQVVSAAAMRTRQRAARRARARERAEKAIVAQITPHPTVSDSATDNESDQELRRLRRSPDRRAIIHDMVHRSSPNNLELPSPPTSPSPPKESQRMLSKDWPISNPFLWSSTTIHPSSQRDRIRPLGDLSPEQRKSEFIARLVEDFPSDARSLKNKHLIHPEFTTLNISDSGVHIFIDISNIMIGFHDCLKLSRGIPLSTRIKRVPMNFHTLNLIISRGRPHAKQVLVGSDKFPIIERAKQIGYETNILERVHKIKEPRQKRFRNDGGTSGSGSETPGKGPEKWVEQAVDEILHLKMLESLIDTDEPSTIILATGDAAEAEFSGGFMVMVERALARGWSVELASFKNNTSNRYNRKIFRSKAGQKFKWIRLDDFVEDLVDDQDE